MNDKDHVTSNQQLKRLRVLAGSSIVGADLKWLLGEYDLLREKADKRGDKLHELRTTLAGMIEAVRALNVERKDWYTHVAMPLQNAYEALGIQGVKLSQEEITALANSPVETSADQKVDIKLPSGETCHINRADTVQVLKELLEWYGGQEKEWYEKTYKSEESFNTGYEREWFRYRREAGGLQLAINLLSGEQT